MFDTIVAAAAALRHGAVTARELTEIALAAVEQHNPRTNAFITVGASQARADAALVDRERATNVDRGPLHGIPVSVKDIIDMAGEVTTAGSRVLDDRPADADAPIVARLRAAGAVIIGKTNLHEFALGTTSDDSAFGAVHHPSDPQRSAGGSSGGSAAAVATGMGLASIGTDTGGSIRIPAAACGLVGLKPSVGEVPTAGVIPLSATLDHVGPLARTVQDAAWVFDVLVGRTPGSLAPRSAAGLRLRRLTGYFSAPIEPAVRLAFDRALDGLAQAGCRLLSGEIANAATTGRIYANILLPEGAHWHAPYLETRANRYSPTVRTRFLSGREIPAVHYLAALDARAQFRQAVDAVLEDCDALILPTMPVVAPLLGSAEIVIDPATGETYPVRAAMLRHTQIFNVSGHPAITLPVRTPTLPVGVQLVGRIGHTQELLEVAAACERELSERG